jgi:hypothetical protein
VLLVRPLHHPSIRLPWVPPFILKLASETTLLCFLRPLAHEAAFLLHLRHPRPPPTSKARFPTTWGYLQVTAFSSPHSYWLSNPPPLDTQILSTATSRCPACVPASSRCTTIADFSLIVPWVSVVDEKYVILDSTNIICWQRQ